MDNLLLDLPLLAVGAHGLVVGSVLLTVPLNLDGSYVDGGSCVVFIIDTTQFSIIQCDVRTFALTLLRTHASSAPLETQTC